MLLLQLILVISLTMYVILLKTPLVDLCFRRHACMESDEELKCNCNKPNLDIFMLYYSSCGSYQL